MDGTLTFHERDVGAGETPVTNCSAAPVTKSEYSIDCDARTGDHDAGLAGRHEFRFVRPAARPARSSSSITVIFADRAIAAYCEHDDLRNAVCRTGKYRDRFGRPAHIPELRARSLRAAQELRIVGEKFMQAAHDLQARLNRVENSRAECRRQETARVRDADEQRSRLKRERIGDARDDPRVAAHVGMELVYAPAGSGRIYDRYDVVAAVAHHAERRLRMTIGDESFGENRIAPARRHGLIYAASRGRP